MILPNFNIVAETAIAATFRERGIHTFYDAIEVVNSPPYGRTKNKERLEQVIIEGRGTCSTKHAVLKALAEEHALYGLKLSLAIYAMDEINTPGVGTILKNYDLPYIFEAHVYLTYNDKVYDYTFPNSQKKLWQNSVIVEVTIDTDQIGIYKQKFHKSVLAEWTQRERLNYSAEELWDIREKCIHHLDRLHNKTLFKTI